MKPAKRSYGASGILKLLAARHSGDVFIPECKDGPTQSGSHMRMDGWAMNKSWANPCVTGYEIKVTRADFIGDNKWPGYLPLCNQFYFVTPPGLIEPSEIPEVSGLLVAAGEGSGTRLLTKKKAPYREVVIPEEVWRYILMCRVAVVPEEPLETTTQRWKNWLERKIENRSLGYEVSKSIRERAVEIERENGRLKSKIATYDQLAQTLDTLGVNLHSWNVENDLRDKVDAKRKVFNPEFLGTLRGAQRAIESALQVAEEIEATQVAASASALSQTVGQGVFVFIERTNL